MKNLFSYAPKELSQDAFLCWLFNNSEEDEIGTVAKELLSEMVNLTKGYNVDPSRLTDIIAYTQVQKIDIVVDFRLDGEPCILVIEDKTRSDEHGEQLVRCPFHTEK